MKILITGQSGLETKSYLKNFKSYAKKKGEELELVSIGDLMYKEDPSIPRRRMLNIEIGRRNQIRRSAFEKAIALSEKKDNFILDTRLTTRWRSGLYPAFEFKQIIEFGADLYITLIDDVDVIKLNLGKRESPHSQYFTLKDIMVWREEEIHTAEILSMAQESITKRKVPFYIIAMGHPIEVIYDLLFNSSKKRVYSSFPITAIQSDPKLVEETKRFREKLSKHLTIFDPLTIDEKRLHQEMIVALQATAPKDWIEIDTKGEKQKLSIYQIIDIIHDIDGQIVSRDFKLIDQSHMIIALVPADTNGRLHISSGVERELQYADQTGKDTFILCPQMDKMSPFQQVTATGVFRKSADLLSELKKRGYLQ